MLQRLADAALGIIGSIFRLESRRVGLAQHIDRFKSFRARAAQNFVDRLRVERLKAALHRGGLAHHAELFYVGERDGWRGSAQRERKVRPHGNGAERSGVLLAHSAHGAIEPAVVRRFYAGRAGLHEILRVKMRARGVGRTCRMNDRELAVVEERAERREARMQAEEAVEIDGRSFHAVARLRNRDRRANAVIVFFAERHDGVQAVGGAALEKDDQLFLVGHGCRGHRALQECGDRAHADHGHAATLQENASRNFHRRFSSCCSPPL